MGSAHVFIVCALLAATSMLEYSGGESAAQVPERLSVALPNSQDLPGFRIYPVAKGPAGCCSMLMWRSNDMARIQIGIMVKPTAEEAAQVPAEYNSRIQIRGGGYKRLAKHPGITAQEVWSDAAADRGPFSVMAIDGRCVVDVLLAPGGPTDAKGYPHQLNHTDADVAQANRLLSDVMERLTALGLTTRPAKSAPAAAVKELTQTQP